MSASAAIEPTVLPGGRFRPRRPYRALGALAVLVGVTLMVGSWIYLGPRPTTYFTVTFAPGVQDSVSRCAFGPPTCDVRGETRADVVRQLGGASFTSIDGPYARYDPFSRSQDADAIRIGVIATLIAYLAFGLLGFSGRFRRLEGRLGNAGAAFGMRLGATTRAKAGSLLLVAAGAVTCGCVFAALAWALDAASSRLTGSSWWNASQLLAPRTAVAFAGVLALFGVISFGALAAIAVLIRRARISRGVGPFLIGYVGLPAGFWVLGLVSTGTSCVSTMPFFSIGPASTTSTPLACVADAISSSLVPSLVGWTLFGAIPAVGALLVYRDYRRRRATLKPGSAHATA